MGAFEYTALDASGKERKGILEGDTPRHIRQLLREQQLLPVTVAEVAQKEAKRQRSFSFVRRAGSNFPISFQWSSMIFSRRTPRSRTSLHSLAGL